MDLIFIGQFVSQEEALTSLYYSQAANMYQKRFIKFIQPSLAISIIPLAVNKNIEFDYSDYPVNFINHSISCKPNLISKILRILRDTRTTINLVCSAKSRDVWFYNITMSTFLIAVYLRFFSNKRLFVLVADYSFEKKLSSRMIRALINSVNGCIVWNSKIKHRNRVVLPDVLDSNAIRKNEICQLRRNVIFSGSLGQTTGFEVVLEYFSRHPDYHLVITGRPYNYSAEQFQELIDKFVTPCQNIVYLGLLPMEEYYRILDSVDIALSFRDPMDTQHDGNFPSKILEYLSFGKIVISTKHYCDIDPNIYFFTKPDELYIDRIFEEIFNLSEEEIGNKRKYIYNYLLENHTETALLSAIIKVSK